MRTLFHGLFHELCLDSYWLAVRWLYMCSLLNCCFNPSSYVTENTLSVILCARIATAAKALAPTSHDSFVYRVTLTDWLTNTQRNYYKVRCSSRTSRTFMAQLIPSDNSRPRPALSILLGPGEGRGTISWPSGDYKQRNWGLPSVRLSVPF